MSLKRRDFFGGLLAAGVIPAAFGSPAIAKAAAAAITGQDEEDEGPGNACAFWSQYYAGHTSSAEHAAFCRQMRGGGNGVDDNRQVSFLHYETKSGQLRFATAIPADELLPYPGDVKVSLSVGGIRLSSEDKATFESHQSAQLRLDLAQNKKMLDIIDKLAWSSIAAIFPKQGKVPPLQDLNFNSQSTNDVYLPGGTGLLGVNVSMARRQSWFYQHLQEVVSAAGKFAPVLGLPAISLNALNGFYLFYGYLENRTTFLFQTGAPQRVYTTQASEQNQKEAAESAGDSDSRGTTGINMPAGEYVLVPGVHATEIKNHLGDYQVVNHYLVPKDANLDQPLYDLADKITPDISYLTLTIAVTPMLEGLGAPAQKPAASSDGGSGGSTSGGAKKSGSGNPAPESKKPPGL